MMGCLRWDVKGQRSRVLCVEDDLWYLAILYGGAVVVSCRIAEGEAGLGSSSRSLVGDLPHALGTVVGVWALEGGTGDVVDAGQYLHRLLEHDPERIGGTVAAEAGVVLTQNRVAVCVDDLNVDLVVCGTVY